MKDKKVTITDSSGEGGQFSIAEVAAWLKKKGIKMTPKGLAQSNGTEKSDFLRENF